MISETELLSKPINLRNECIFYLGHIPTFFDIHLARSTDGKPSEPAWFWNIFERGIDPDVEDPTKCHDHSQPPEAWPPLEVILQHQQAVRDRAESLYASGEVENNQRVARAMWLGFEHEAMHLVCRASRLEYFANLEAVSQLILFQDKSLASLSRERSVAS
jgi:hypothetical protein